MSATALDAEQFWRRSLLAATGCRILGERVGQKNLEELFLAGLLHGIGIMALAIMMPDRYFGLLAEATDHQIEEVPTLDCERLAVLERERLQIDDAQVGSWLLHRWGLPDYLCQAVRGSLEPSDPTLSEQYRTLVECVALSIHLADIWVRPGYWQKSSQVAELARQWLGLGEDDYVETLEAISAKFPEIAELFQIKALDAVEVAGILDQAREVLTIRILHVAVTDTEPHHQRVQRLRVLDRLLRRAQVRLGDDLQQRSAGAVQVDAAHAVEVLVQALAGVLLEVGAGEAHRLLVGLLPFADANHECAALPPAALTG